MVQQNRTPVKTNTQPKQEWQGDFRKTTPEYKLFAEYWQLCKSFWNPDISNSSEFYSQLIDKSTEFTDKFGSHELSSDFDKQFVKDITMSFLHLVERKERVLEQEAAHEQEAQMELEL